MGLKELHARGLLSLSVRLGLPDAHDSRDYAICGKPRRRNARGC